jgi:thiamine biosynthesis lipoprotein
MGMSFGVVLYAADEEAANRGFDAAFRRIEQLNRVFSDYDVDSEVSRLCDQSPTSQPVAVSEEMADVLVFAQRLSEQTDGAFDVTVGPLTKLWRRARRNYQLPDPDRLRSAQQSVGFHQLVVNRTNRTVELNRPEMRLDFGAIVPGYAADEALRVLARHGIRRALVNASGDITVGDPPPGATAWKIDIAPLERGGPPSKSVRVARASVSTSGDAFQFVEIGGQRYSHIVDPKTGYGLTRRSSVTVIAPTGLQADGLATAVSVLGPEKGLPLIEATPETAAYIVMERAGSICTFESRHFKKYVEPPRTP